MNIFASKPNSYNDAVSMECYSSDAALDEELYEEPIAASVQIERSSENKRDVETGQEHSTWLDCLKDDSAIFQDNEGDKKTDTFAGRHKKEPDAAVPIEEESDSFGAALDEEIETGSDKINSSTEKGKGNELLTSLDYLKSDSMVIQGNTTEAGAENEVSNNDSQVEGDQVFHNLAKLVARKVENIEDIKTNLKPEETGMFNCVFCDRDMESKMKMVHHIDMHVKLLKQPLESCAVCSIQLPQMFICLHQELHDHPIKAVPSGILSVPRDIRNDVAYFLTERLGKQQKVYKCSYCEAEFCRVYSLKRHYIRQHTIRYVCQECRTSANSLIDICKHLKIHKQTKNRIVKDLESDVSEGVICCRHCHMTFSDKSSLTRHLKLEHVDTDFLKFSCTKCRKSFISSTALNIHVQTHDEPFPCKIGACDRVFKSQRQLSSHKRIHLIAKFVCSYCGKAYTCRKRFSEHIDVKHKGRKPLECDICGKKYHTTEAHSRHMRTHVDSSNYVCEQCGERCKTVHCLWYHKRKHSEKKKVKCFTCQAAFSKLESLQIHLVNHKHFSEQQPESLIKYKMCSYCGKKLANGRQLNRHIEFKHSEPKQCTYCDKKFRDRANLRVHLQTHTNTKPRCSVCDVVFRSIVKLKEHMSTFHPSTASVIEKSVRLGSTPSLIEKSVRQGSAMKPDNSMFQSNRNNSITTTGTVRNSAWLDNVVKSEEACQTKPVDGLQAEPEPDVFDNVEMIKPEEVLQTFDNDPNLNSAGVEYIHPLQTV